MFRRLCAEFIGTFWLVLGGCGSAVLAAGFPNVGIGFVGVALAFGLTVLTMAYAVGGISGGHFNPAVSLGLAIAGRFDWRDLVPYWVVQVIGGAVGAAVLYVIASGVAGYTPGGRTSGDLTSLEVRQDGSAYLVTTTDAFNRDDLLAGNKTALMLHGAQDSENAMDRVACGVIGTG